MIPIREMAGVLHPSRKPSRRFIVVFKFYCDERYDPPRVRASKGAHALESKKLCGGRFFADQKTWERVERRWDSKNERVNVPRFHAAHLNTTTWAYDGWSDSRKIRYSRVMLRILKQQNRKLHGISCGVNVEDYRRIISPAGQVKMGHPDLVCFKSVIVTIAGQMDYVGFAKKIGLRL